jgi:hypothetical protein
MVSMPVKLTLAIAFCSAALMLAFAAHRQIHMAPPAPRMELLGGRTSLPMQEFGGRPVVEVTINGKGPYRFILDTGAHISLVGAELNKELKLPEAGVHAAPSGAGPAPQIVSIEVMGLGDAHLHGVMAAVMPLGGFFKDQDAPSGVLSASSFPGYLLTLDYPGKRIVLEKGELESADSQTTFEYKSDEILPTVPIRVAGHETRVHVDTGSPMGLVLPARFLSVLPLASQPKEAGKARTPGGEFPISTAPVDGEIRLGKYILVLREVRFSDVSPGPVPPSGNIGYGVLQDFMVTLDSKNRRIRFAQ